MTSTTQFDLLLRNEKLHQYDRLALLFILLNAGVMVWLAVTSDIYLLRNIGFYCFIFIAFLLSLYFTLHKKNKLRPALFPTAGLIISSTWLILEIWLLAFLCAGVVLLYMLSKRKLLVRITEEYILYPSIPVKTVDWKELNTVILKDGLLTLNFTNNRFIQQLVDLASTPVDEQEFNEFCRQQLGS